MQRYLVSFIDKICDPPVLTSAFLHDEFSVYLQASLCFSVLYGRPLHGTENTSKTKYMHLVHRWILFGIVILQLIAYKKSTLRIYLEPHLFKIPVHIKACFFSFATFMELRKSSRSWIHQTAIEVVLRELDVSNVYLTVRAIVTSLREDLCEKTCRILFSFPVKQFADVELT